MALVGHISGSQQSNSLIAVSGTVIVANRPDATFPSTLPGADVSFFVSGSRGGKGAATRTVSLFGGDAVVSGSLTIGTGSLTITSNDLQFSSFSNRIELDGSNNLKFYDAANPSGYTLSSLATSSPAGSDTQVQFNDGGNMGADGGLVYNKTTDTLTAGTLAATGSTGLSLTGNATINGNIDTTEVSENKSIFASVTSNTYSITIGGGADVVAGGNLRVGGNIIKASDGANALTLTNSTGDVAVAGDLTITGNDIKSSGGTTAITLSGANVILPGDLTVNGTTVTVDATTVSIEDPVIGLGFTSGSISAASGDRGWIGGLTNGNNVAMYWKNDATEFQSIYTGNSAGSGSISRLNALGWDGYANFSAGRVWAKGGLSGSLTQLTDGTSYLIAGSGITISSASNGAVTISTGAGAGDVVGPASATDNAIVRFDQTTGKLIQNSGVTISDETANAITVAGSATATTISLFNSTATTVNAFGAGTAISIGAAAGTTTFAGSGSIQGTLGVAGATSLNGNVTLGDASADTITVNGTMTVTPNATFTGDIAVNGGDITTTSTGTATVFNTNATALNMGGAATTMQVGATNVAMAVGGAGSGTSTITAATGSFGRVLASSTSTFTGQTTHNGGISTTTFAASSTAQFIGAATFSGTTTHTNTTNNFNALAVTGSLGVNVTSGVQIGGALGVTGSAGFNGSVTLGDASADTVTVNGTTTFAGAAVTTTFAGSGSIQGTLGVAGATSLNGNVTLGDASADTITFNGYVGSNVLPTTDRAYNLGSPTNRWNNIYTGDLHLRNERGNWTVIEEETYLSIRNNHTGRMYKFVLEEIPGPLEPIGE